MESLAKLFKMGSRKGPPKEYEPGLRSMLYGLHQKQEKEEAEMKKRQKKQLAFSREITYCISSFQIRVEHCVDDGASLRQMLEMASSSPSPPRILLQTSNCSEDAAVVIEEESDKNQFVRQSISLDVATTHADDAAEMMEQPPSLHLARTSLSVCSSDKLWPPSNRTSITLKRQKRSHTSSPFKKTRSITLQNLQHLQAAAHVAHMDLHRPSNMRKSFSDFVLGFIIRGAENDSDQIIYHMALLVIPQGPSGEMDHLTVPDSPQQKNRRRDVPGMWNELRNKSISELSLVFDMFRGPSPSTSQVMHPERERASQSTGNLQTPPKGGRRRRRMRHTWKALSTANLARHYVLVQEEKAMQAVPTAPIDANKFVAYVTERRKKRILFKGEYLMINRSIDATKCRTDVGATLTERNPYPDTLPYDYNRVILPRLPCDENSHYINASYVNSWLREKAYVVTQAVRTKPMNVEFWRMVWELGSNCIVMLTKVFDFMRVMCLQYWPLTRFTFGDIEVETIDTHTYAHFVIRTFRLTRKAGEDSDSRIVKHFHFTEWELDSFPYISAFIELRRRVRQFTDKNPVDAPIIVHCSELEQELSGIFTFTAGAELVQHKIGAGMVAQQLTASASSYMNGTNK
ncbi:hypothetical protein GCK32_009078 [Trichostrongylus colubriformis]|uniref:Tyrosine-protein phosphatase domain-containing protein n=1 Tax=Trichostrongylus colubriformis TaxID=6319 RepID=A0AAN8FQY8_TRICO